MRLLHSVVLAAISVLVASVCWRPLEAQLVQQGSPLTGNPTVAGDQFGSTVAISADGNTAAITTVGNGSTKEAGLFIFVRVNGVWTQQGGELAGSGQSTPSGNAGSAVAISADGNTVIYGDPTDNGEKGNSWVFTRTGTTWTQQSKLTGASTSQKQDQGTALALSSDGNTALIGAPTTASFQGRAFVFTRSGTTWTQQASLTASGLTAAALQGTSVALSSDGNTAVVGLPADSSNAGSFAVFTRSGSTWTQQGGRLTPSDASGMASFGRSVAVASDGNTVVVGGSGDNSGTGAVWIFTRLNGVWMQQGAKIVPPDASASTNAGWSVAITSDGNTIVFGGPFSSQAAGGVWVYTRSGNTWTQQGSTLHGTGSTAQCGQGTSVALSPDGTTLIEGGPFCNGATGAAFAYSKLSCTITLGGGGINFPAAGGTNTVSVTAPAGCTWSASSNEPWLNITSGATGSGNGIVTFTAAANTGPARVGPTAGMISVPGATPPSVTITQDSGCSLISINPTTQNIPAGGGTNLNVAVTLSDSSCPVSAIGNAPWISIIHAGPNTTYSVQSNFHQGSASSPRHSSISIGISGQTSGVQTLTLNQDGSSAIDGVEVTQAIQVYQKISDLEASLMGSGEPPVSIIAGKPAVMRVMMMQTSEVQVGSIRVTGAVSGSQAIPMQPHCSPNGVSSSQRRGDNGCRSIDFYFTPPAGTWTATVQSLDHSNAVLETHVLTFKSRITDHVSVKGVGVCPQLDTHHRLICTSPDAVTSLIAHMRKIFPSASFFTQSTDNKIVAIAPSFADSNNELNYWTFISTQTSRLFPQNDDAIPQGSDGVHRVYVGTLNSALVQTVAGMAGDIPSNGMVVAAPKDPRFIDEPSEDASHETGHTFGLRHTGNMIPPQDFTKGGIGCWTVSADPQSTWPYGDNYMRSGSAPGVKEVGFDVQEASPVLPESNFEVMGYCFHRWISPTSYLASMNALNVSALGATSAPQHPRPNALPTGNFWTVSGTVSGSTVNLDPVFSITAQGTTLVGTGTWRIVVQASNGTTLYTRNFTPEEAHGDGVAGVNSAETTPGFYELVPVSQGASKIAIFNDSGVQLATIPIGGVAPTPTITTPLAGMTSGPMTLAWTITDPDSTSFTSRVFYSKDSGTTWLKIGETTDTTLPVDFDILGGSNPNSKVRIDVSDGVNTGSVTSGTFTVPRKNPSAPNIIAPKPNAFYQTATMVTLNASIYDVDDGLLDGAAVQWSSSLDGNLGTGALLYTTTLHQGTHTITVKGTDSDGNSVTGTVQITIAGAPPTLNLTFAGLNNNPVSCVQATIAATPGSVPLASAQYSFDGGTTFAGVPVGELPATIGIPGAGPIHFIAQVTDMANQVAASDATFTIASACSAAAALQAGAQPLSFHATQNGASPAPQSLNVTATGAAVTFATSAVSSGWLSVAQPSGPTPQAVSVSVNSAGLTAGPYNGSVILTPLNGGAQVSVMVNLAVGTPCSFTFLPPSASPSATGGPATVLVTASDPSCTWTASSNAAWLAVNSGASDTGNGTVGYTADANNSVSPRSGSLTIAGQTFTVNEAGATPTFSLGANSASVGAGANSGLSIAVNATPPDAAWTATSNAPWIAITLGATGTGNGAVQYSVAQNTSVNQRVGTITVAGLTFTVTQAGAGATFTLNPASANVAATAGTGTFSVTASPSDATWTATPNVSWISISSGANGTGNGTVGYSIAASNSINQRTGTISVGGQAFTITQAAVTASFTLAPPSASVAANGGTGSVTVTANAIDATWTATSNASWISITSGATGTGNGSVAYSAVANTSVNSRTGTLTIAGQTFTIMQAGAGTTFTLGATSATATATGGTGSVTVTANPSDAAWTAVSNVPFISITAGASGTGNGSVSYSVTANNSVNPRTGTLTIAGQTFTITQAGAMATFTLGATSASATAAGGTGSVTVTATPADATWTAVSNVPWIIISSGANGTGNGTVNYTAAANSTTAQRVGTLTIAGQIFTITQAAPSTSSGLAFYPVAPCRISDTRGGFPTPFGTPSMAAGSTRAFPITQSGCNIPANAQAYSLNVTVVPPGPLTYLTIWPTGQPQPVVSTLNAVDGSVVANAAIVPAGTNGSISVFVSDATDVIIDINGYFAPQTPQGLAFYPVAPCRIADTRNSPGAFGGPTLAAGGNRSFAIPTSGCAGVPINAQAYSLNMTVVPPGHLTYLSTWPTGQSLPVVSTLNSFNGRIVANAAIVPAGTGGAISVFVSDATDVIIDINGYFGPPGAPGAMYFYPTTPCRVVDTRGNGLTGAFGTPAMSAQSTRTFPVPTSSCGLSATAQAYSLNMTVIPAHSLGYLTTWPAGQTQPLVSTLNSLNGTIVANAALLPAGTNGAISVFVTDLTDLIIDANGYFAP
ncbi:MAG TPA: BACON domain-containing carbohydrate-binding protein [Bryobacteraceae bacterium]|nr:BACON domain-containing carbohydrate-binding protein [Bryobacteraceae bacterium]